MRTYTVDNQDIIVSYRYIAEGLELSTWWKDKSVHKHYRVDLTPYSELLDLIDDLSYQFIKEELQ